jgi:hypothetical protein
MTAKPDPPPNIKKPHQTLTTRAYDFWLARIAILVVILLQLGFVNDLTLGPRWLAPSFEFALLIVLSVGTAWTQKRAAGATTSDHWLQVGKARRGVRVLAVGLTAIVTLMNLGALGHLIEAILAGHAAAGRTLLLDSVNIWLTNVVIFALWYWTLDRGGPAGRGLVKHPQIDFLFTQQQSVLQNPEWANWSPGFIDYLFLAFTNATAFSPADAFPLTARAKLLMMAEASISLTTIAIVASRAVGILS